MRFLSLDLRAFGPFTDRSLDLSGGSEGLHLVYGPNEAGKSSALRALGALLYGVDARSPDNFLHPHPALRIGAALRHSNGSELRVVRRKGNRETLLDPGDDRPLPEDLLGPYLGGVDRNLFEALFGISHATLVEGGKSLLAQKGEVGQALFSAGLGSANLHEVIAVLEEEAAGLFSRTARRTSIAQGLSRLAQARNLAAAESLSTREWEEKRDLLEGLRQQREEAKEKARALQEERSRLERIRLARPHLADRARLRETVRELAGARLLAEDFASRRHGALDRLQTARQDAARARTALDGLREKLEGLTTSRALLGEKEEIEALHQELGSVTKGAEDAVKLEARAREQQLEAERVFRKVRPGRPFSESEGLRPLQGLRPRVTELEKKRVALGTARELADEALGTARSELEGAERRLAETQAPPDPVPLRQAVARARKAGDLDAEILTARDTFTEHQRRFRAEFSRLQPPPPSEVLQTLAVPLPETVQDFRDRWSKITLRQDRLEAEREQLGSDLEACEQKIRLLLAGGRVPSEEELARARARRDAGWALVRSAWALSEAPEKPNEAFDPERPLAEAFERSVAQTDDLADELRRAGARVLSHQGLKSERERLERLLAASAAEKESLDRAFGELREEWTAAWAASGVNPLPPRQMESWLSTLAVVRTHHATLEATTKAGRAQRERRDELVEALGEKVRAAGGGLPAGATLAEALEAAQERLDGLDEEWRIRRETERSVPELRTLVAEKGRKAEAAKAEWEEWQARWAALMVQLGLSEHAFEAEAAALLDDLETLFQGLGEARKYHLRIEGIREEATSFQARVRELCGAVAADLVEVPAAAAARELNQRLSAAQQEERLRDEHLEGVETHSANLADAETREALALEELAALCREAGCDSADELPVLEERSARLRAARSRLEEVGARLEELTYGADRDAFERTASEMDPDSLPGLIEERAADLAEVQARLEEQNQRYGAEEKLFQAMDARATAANAAQEAQEIRARLRSDAERYVQAALAARVLREEIERFREENEDPLLKRASDFFARMTCGRYARLRADYGERDERVLHGVRTDGTQVPVDRMSDGTRDQVYLALRLAALERHVARAEPLPFVVDDVLVQFDDERGAATLETLADFARGVQVILFTHHRHVLDAARRLSGRADVILHDLTVDAG